MTLIRVQLHDNTMQYFKNQALEEVFSKFEVLGRSGFERLFYCGLFGQFILEANLERIIFGKPFSGIIVCGLFSEKRETRKKTRKNN